MISIIPSEFFKREFDDLFKKFRNIAKDVDIIVQELKTNPRVGKSLGNNCYKIRVKNSDINKGKSGGYRIITYIIRDDKIYLLAIYSKTEKMTISDQEISNRIKSLSN